MKLAVLVLCLGVASAVDFEAEFAQFSSTHNKQYDAVEFFRRFEIFSDNLRMINEHNAAGHSYKMGVNQYTDMTDGEFKALMTGYIPASKIYGTQPEQQVLVENFTPKADAVDWRAQGAVTPIKDQGQCGSCWAFSTTGSFEGAYQQATGTLKSFSEQQLVDCAGSFGNNGCSGGLMDNGFQYIAKNGLCEEDSYRYTARDGSCQTSCQKTATLSAYQDLSGEAGVEQAIETGPVSIAIDAESSLQHYSSGLYSGPCGEALNHGVLVVGYTTEAWIVKNSWGTGWGESGYVNFVRGKNLCGMGDVASVPTGVKAL